MELGKISKLAVVETDRIGSNVTVGEFSVIRKGVTLGDDVVVHPHVVIEPGVTIGNGTEIFPYTYIGKEPKGAGATARNIEFDREVVIGANCCLGPSAVIYCDVQIGDSIREKSRVGSKTIIGRHVTLSYVSIIGSHTKILDHCTMGGNVTVGDHVFIGTDTHTANDNSFGAEGYKDDMIGPTIKDDANIGVGALLLPGIVIEKGVLIGAGSVVYRSVKEGFVTMAAAAREMPRPPAKKE
jgi:UDP-3-O-[3-hydroxymyristoyl] glucosamine N-acyltransferase